MIRSWTIFLSAVCLLALAGCSSVQVSQDYDPAALISGTGTFAWRHRVQPATGDVRVDNPLLDRRIRTAIEKHLTARGFALDPKRPDMYLAYHLGIEPVIQGVPDDPFYGVRGYRYPWYGGFPRETRIYQYDDCRLTIDVLAAGSDRLVWRGTGVYRCRTYNDPHKAAADIQRTVDRIMAQFPPDQNVR